MKNIRIGELLVEAGIITQTQLEGALQLQKDSDGKRLGDVLIESEIISETQLLQALKKRLNVELIDMQTNNIAYDLVKMVPQEFARKNNLIPLRMEGDSLVVVMHDPLNYYALNDLTILTGKQIETALASKQDIQNAISKFYAKHQVDSIAKDLARDPALNLLANQDFSEADGRAENSPIVKFVNTIIEQGNTKRASDIHIEPFEDYVVIRFRIDGSLLEVTRIGINTLAALVTRIKILGGMDIAERRVPLDGRFEIAIRNTSLNIRVSTIPTIFGEKIVMRLMADNSKGILTIEQLGMRQYNMDNFYKLIKNPNGIILVTGPTGSGKSTTLYSALAELSTPDKNVVTVEDPVEKIVPRVNHTNINAKAGLTFAAGLRSLLRQDPDIIMIGEIRDGETADIAARAAITGHLVVSSLHTNSACSSFMRLVDMGIEPYIVSSSVIGVVAQRLVRTICPKCKTVYKPSREDLYFLKKIGVEKLPKIYVGEGCQTCNFNGSIGRMAIHEVVIPDGEVRSMIIARQKSEDITAHMKSRGQKFLVDNALELLMEGRISLKEVMHITQISDYE